MEDDDRLIAKPRQFAQGLEPGERVLLAQLLAPGVARAYEPEPEVFGFDLVPWSERALPASLVAALREGGIRVVGLDAEAPAAG